MTATLEPSIITEFTDRMERCKTLGYDYAARATRDVVTCNVCRQKNTYPIAQMDRYGFAVTCLECKNCQTAWLTPRMSPADYQDFYSHWYRPLLSAWYGKEFSAESIETDQTLYARIVCDSLSKWIIQKNGGSLLDVGGSTGIMAQALADMFQLVPTVLDPCEAELARAKQRGFATIHGQIESTGIFEKFDVITMMQTIEHLSDPRAVMLKLKCLLNPGGIIIFDCNQWQMQKTAKPIEMFVKIDHLHYFADYSIRWLVESCGLNLITKVSCQTMIDGAVRAIPNKWHYICRAA